MAKQTPEPPVKTAAAEEETGSVIRAPAVARAAAVLRLLAGNRTGLGVTEIARRVELVPSTCFHVLRALVDEGFVAFDPINKTYRTGAGLIALVREAMAASEYPKVVQPWLDELVAKHHVTAIAVELDRRDRLVVVALSRSDALVSLHVNVGSRFLALTSATGRCIAAARNATKAELKKEFEGLRWEKAPRFEEWYADVERAKIEGVAVDRSSYIRGLTVMSSLIPQHVSAPTRGIAMVGFDHQMTERALRAIKDDLLHAVRSVATSVS
jgi:DNA-binding IclR family transcriptional regulator